MWLKRALNWKLIDAIKYESIVKTILGVLLLNAVLTGRVSFNLS
ncbi:hypothetical protein CK203_113909 [Vitis vinifera]|uniref:Uncharacterized protein n=1 Tax=Vitis vinifera TaxID=29760 RepID=A0A438CPU3_VITVI|nr:hypothetical protein CK203_113909 [Vitis vinifera]